METGRFVDVIVKKRQGGTLTEREVRQMIEDYVRGDIPDYQMAAMLMAIFYKGMEKDELTELTLAMRDSGDIVDLSPIQGIKVDKHSTGGVGDKTTLILGPIVSACGVPVAKMSGRGLGFTGGTLDKLESIPGFRVDLEPKEFFQAVEKNGLSVIGQTGNLAPADKMLYALRDVTGTVESIELIAASIMSKKLAAGADKILLDVTTGSGAFIPELERSRKLAKCMVDIGNGAGKETVALITGMDEPLGHAVGNNLEVKEVIETLQGGGPEDLREVCIALSGMMISLGKENTSWEEGKELAKKALESGAAWEKFRGMVQAQGGDVTYIDDPSKFPVATVQHDIVATQTGYIASMETQKIGITAGVLGAGREKKDSVIDNSAGLIVHKKIGDYVTEGDVVATLYCETKEQAAKGEALYRECCEFSDEKPEEVKLIVELIR
ncbi:MAG: pyrimidine-nucleoside phosphorylase [Eubacterium sp.]|nr:pyrimidine-nucleoside phosphorylase [Eubacterium sp.]